MARTQDICELVSRAQQGDRGSLGVLSARVRRRVFVYLYRMTLDYHLAEDLVQETVLYMIESLPRLKSTSSSSLWAWVYRSAWGIYHHYVRPQGHQRIIQNTVVNHEALLQLTDQINGSALEQAEQAEFLEAVCESLGKLQPKHRSVLILRCFELLSHAEIASVMGCSELKSRVLFFHAKHALQRQLHNRGYGRQYFLTGLALFGLITGMHAKSASAAITVTTSLSKTRTVAGVAAAVTGKVGLVRAAVIAVMFAGGTVYICSSGGDVPTGATIEVATTGQDENALSAPERIGNAAETDSLLPKDAADLALPDPCGVDTHEAAGMPALGPIDGLQPLIAAGLTQPAPGAGKVADPNE